MKEDKRNRRRFLADLLFAGAALSGATFLAKSVSAQSERPLAAELPTPKPASPVGTPVPTGPYPVTPGGAVAPRRPPQPPEPKLGGKPVAPVRQPNVAGAVRAPVYQIPATNK